MARKYSSPLTAVAAVSTSSFSAYDALIAARTKALEEEIASYANTGTVPGPIATPGRILYDATYLPAHASAVNPDRGGKLPNFIVLGRCGAADAPPAAANITNIIQSALGSSAGGVVVPHVLVGYTGEIVQFADLEAKTNFLEGRTYSPPGAIGTQTLLDAAIDSIIELTAANESGAKGYAAFAVDQVVGGINFGIVQFNQRKGVLYKLLRRMNEKNPQAFATVFGSYANELLTNPSWVANTDLSPLASMFAASAEVPEFRAAQRELARQDYWGPAVEVCTRLGVTSQRAYAIAYDGCIQRGPGFMKTVALPAAIRAGGDSLQKLKTLATWADEYSLDGKLITDATALRNLRQRRTVLLNDPDLSDAPLTAKDVVQATVESVSDATSVSIALEGRVGDVVTRPQRDALAKVIRAVCNAYSIQFTTSRIFGLDRVAGGKDPGPNFSYIDILGAVAAVPINTTEGWFRPAEPVTANALRLAVASLQASLLQSRSNIQSIALLQCYNDAKAFARAVAVATATRNTTVRAAAEEAAKRRANQLVNVATVQKDANAVKPIPGMSRDSLRGLLYDFKTGLWSDDKPCGRIS